MRYLLIFLLALLAMPASAAPTTAAQADAAYKQKDYAAAARLYEQCIDSTKKDTHADHTAIAGIYYNLGNCHYRLKDFAHAVLSYKRALRLNPADDDAAFNLQLTQAKLTDHFDAPSEMFFVSWAKALIGSQSSNAWGLLALIVLVAAFGSFAAYRFCRPMWLRKTAFGLTIATAILYVLFQLFALIQHSHYSTVQEAVVMQTADAYDSPTPSAKKMQTLHEGTVVTLVDTYKGGWLQASLPDGKEVWLKEQGLEKVAN